MDVYLKYVCVVVNVLALFVYSFWDESIRAEQNEWSSLAILANVLEDAQLMELLKILQTVLASHHLLPIQILLQSWQSLMLIVFFIDHVSADQVVEEKSVEFFAFVDCRVVGIDLGLYFLELFVVLGW